MVLPADGFVNKGAGAINQAPVTGESIPVDKEPVADVEAARAKPDAVEATSRVFAGTINGGAAIEIEVTRRSNESALAKVVRSEEHTSELQSLMRFSYAVFCLKKKKYKIHYSTT